MSFDQYVELWKADFWNTWVVYAIGVFALGGVAGWKLCELLQFGRIRMKMHEHRILQEIDRQQAKP